MTKEVLWNYDYNSDNKKYLDFYLSNLINNAFPAGKTDMKSRQLNAEKGINTFDDVNEYIINSNGFRSSEFSVGNTDILAVGCSITFGIGVPIDGAWPSILESKTNKKVTNMSLPGESVTSICNRIIKYCMNYENPKSIYCFFPDFFRMLFVQDFDYHVSKKYLVDKKPTDKNLSLVSPNVANDMSYYYENGKNKLFFNRKTWDSLSLEDSVSPHQAILESINAIYMLESFCKTNKIELVWSTWSNITKVLLEKMLLIPNFELTQYKPFNEITNKTYDPNKIISDCKKDHSTDLVNNVCWKRGTDFMAKGNEILRNFLSHPGIHFHYHVADFFNDFI